MLIHRLIRCCHGPIVCLCIASLFCVGCATGSGRNSGGEWSKETVAEPAPHEAFVAEDGSLLLSFYIEREAQPDQNGWHWLVVDPMKTSKLLEPRPATQPPSVYHHIWLDWTGSDGNLYPPIDQPGLAEAYPPPGEHGALTPWGLRRDGRWGGYVLQPLGDTGEMLRPRILLTPNTAVVQSPEDARLERRAEALAAPIEFAGKVLFFPVKVVGASMYMALYICHDTFY